MKTYVKFFFLAVLTTLFSCEEETLDDNLLIGSNWTEIYTINQYQASDGYYYDDVNVVHSYRFMRNRTGEEFFTYTYYIGRGKYGQDKDLFYFDWNWYGTRSKEDALILDYGNGDVDYLRGISLGYKDGMNIISGILYHNGRGVEINLEED